MELVIVLFVVATLIVSSLLWQYNHTQYILLNWAAKNGYQLLDARYVVFPRGPFASTTSRAQTVYQVMVLDRRGCVHEGWVRCGSWWGDMMGSQTHVRWNDE